MREGLHTSNSTEIIGPKEQRVAQIQVTSKSKGFFSEAGSGFPEGLSSYHREVGRDG